MPSGTASTPTRTLQGFTKAVYLTDQDLDLIIEAVRSGLPVEFAARQAGTSASQFRIRYNREPQLKQRFEDAYEEGYPNFQDLIRNEWFYQAFTEKNWKALDRLIMVHLPEAELLRTQRFEHTVNHTNALIEAAREAFKDMSLAEIEAKIRLLETSADQHPLIEQNAA